MGAERTPEGHEPDEGPDAGSVPNVDPASIDWSTVPIDDPRWELIDEIELEDDTPSGAPPDPSQRTWRHPSEVAAANAHMDRFLSEDAQRLHPASQFGGQYRSSPVTNSRLMLAVAAGALVVAGVSIWSNSPDSVISDTAAAMSIASSVPNLGLADASVVGSALETPVPTTTVPEVGAGSAQALSLETVSAPPPWAYEVLSGDDVSSSSTLATAIRIDGLAPEFLITSASAIGLRETVMLAAHDPERDRPDLMSALVIGIDPTSDIAVLRVGLGDESPFAASIGPQDRSELGAQVEIQPGIAATTHSGTILSISAESIETSAPVPTGHLGAAVVDALGRVIGVVVESPSMLASAIPATECQRIASNIADYGVANPNWLGITITTNDSQVEVVDVIADGPADRAGIEVGDRLLGAGGSIVVTPEQLSEIVADQNPTSELEFVVERDGSVSSVSVTVGQRPKTALSPSWVDT
ncbi:MAG: S1C family serine protease [Acidimicrobiales bacterium]